MNGLTANQVFIIETAAKEHKGQLVWFPENLKGAAKNKTLESLAKRELIVQAGDGWKLTKAAYEAVDLPAPKAKRAKPAQAEKHPEQAEERTAQAEEHAAQAEEKPARAPRENTKQAQVIAMLEQEGGATIAEIQQATGWQEHTVRGLFYGALKKKGLLVKHTKASGEATRYML